MFTTEGAHSLENKLQVVNTCIVEWGPVEIEVVHSLAPRGRENACYGMGKRVR